MGFLSGRMSFEQFKIEANESAIFGPDHLETLDKFAIGKVESSSADGVLVGFCAGDHLFDLKFDLEKNVVNEALHCAVRIDTNKIPSALRRAWLQMEIAVLLAESPHGKLTKIQRQEANEAVEARCEEEAASGKFRRMGLSSVLWDGREQRLYVAGSSENCIDLFGQAFDLTIERVSAGKLAHWWAAENKKLKALDEAVPSVFHADESTSDVNWVNHETGSVDYLGNEFLLWLWWYLDTQDDIVPLEDKSDVSVMLTRTLSLECPRGESGKDTITAEAPVHLPEAAQAIQSGKLPRKTGMILARHGEQYELVLQAETFAISGAKIQSGDDDEGRTVEDRIDSIRQMNETVRLLFNTFCARRLVKTWSTELEQIRRWMKKGPATSKRPAA